MINPTNDTIIKPMRIGNEFIDDETTVLKPVKVGDEFNTTAGNFKIVDIGWSDEEGDYKATCIWTVYKNDGTIYDVTKCVITFGDLEYYLKYNYTDDVTVKLIYERR